MTRLYINSIISSHKIKICSRINTVKGTYTSFFEIVKEGCKSKDN